MNANPQYTPNWWVFDSGSCFDTYHHPSGTGIPQSMIFDRDGYQRWLQYGGIHSNPGPMHDCIEELL